MASVARRPNGRASGRGSRPPGARAPGRDSAPRGPASPSGRHRAAGFPAASGPRARAERARLRRVAGRGRAPGRAARAGATATQRPVIGSCLTSAMAPFNRCRRRCKDSVRGGQALLSENAVCGTVGTGSSACRKPFSPSPSSRHSLRPRLPARGTCRCTCERSRSRRVRSRRCSPRSTSTCSRSLDRHGHRRLPHAPLHGTWQAWRAADADNRTGAWHDGNLDWTGASGDLQFRVTGTVRRLRSYEVWSRVTARLPGRSRRQASRRS